MKVYPEITYELVKTTAEHIFASGVMPNVLNVRRALSVDADEEVISEFLTRWEVEVFMALVQRSGADNEAAFYKFIQKCNKGLELSLALTRATLESTEDGILVVGNNGMMIDYNDRFLELWNMPREIMEQRNDEVALRYVMNQLKDPDSFVEKIQKEYQDTSRKGIFSDLHFKDGRVFERYSQPYIVNGEIKGRVWSLRDVTQRRKYEKKLFIQHQAIESAHEGIAITTSDFDNPMIITANTALAHLFAYEYGALIGKNLFNVINVHNSLQDIQNIQKSFLRRQAKPIEILCTNYNHEKFWVELRISRITNAESGDFEEYFIFIITDISERKKMESQLIYQATHDPLTGLPNRTILYDRISQGIIQAKSREEMLGIVFIDIDYFKLINDSLGHNIGDQVLKQFAQRLTQLAGEANTVARLGGDEFVIVYTQIKSESSLIYYIEEILREVSEPFKVNDNDYSLTVSMGVSCFPKDSSRPEALISQADTAMYQVKESGRNNYRFFTRKMNQVVFERLRLQTALSSALEKNEFELHYQPIICLQTNQVVAIEGLLRWRANHLESIRPDTFIPIAEETGLIIPIGAWVIDQACAMNKRLWDMDIPLNVAFNISARQVKEAKVVDTIREAIEKHGVQPELMIMELSENALTNFVSEKVANIREIKKLGIKISIDDFGAGHSSLKYIKEMDIDELKIDQSFVRGIFYKKVYTEIVSGIILLAKKLDLSVTAEGVETGEQLNLLRELHCDNVQGYYYAKPMPADKMIEYIKKFNYSSNLYS